MTSPVFKRFVLSRESSRDRELRFETTVSNECETNPPVEGKALYRPRRSVTFWFNKTTSRWRDLGDFRRAGERIYEWGPRGYARWDAPGHVDNTVSHLNSDRVSVPSIERTCSVCERIVNRAFRDFDHDPHYVFHAIKEIRISTRGSG